MAEFYAEGTTRLSPDGKTRAIVRGGKWVTEPVGAGGGALPTGTVAINGMLYKRDPKTGGPASSTPLGPVSGGMAPKRSAAMEKAIGENDAKRLQVAGENATQAYGISGDLSRMQELARVSPTGTFANARLAASKIPLIGGMAGLSRTDTANLEELNQLAGSDVLAKASALKPMSNMDIQYVEKMTAGIGTSPEGNRRAIAARQWAVKKSAAYESALQTWTEKLGSPSALNPKGESFDRWWGGYSARALPRPDLARPAPTPKARAAAAVGNAQPSAVMSYDAKGNRIR